MNALSVGLHLLSNIKQSDMPHWRERLICDLSRVKFKLM